MWKRWWGWGHEKVGLRISVEGNEYRVERGIKWRRVVGIMKVG